MDDEIREDAVGYAEQQPHMTMENAQQQVGFQYVPPGIVPPTPTLLISTPCTQIVAAFAKAQAGFGIPARTKEATVQGKTASGSVYSYKYKYAPLEEVHAAVAGPLADNGIARQQVLTDQDTALRTILWHVSGEWMACDYPIFKTRDGNQGFASGVSYARRYGLSLVCGLAPEDDDDGSQADNVPVEQFSGPKVVGNKKAPPNKPIPEKEAKPEPPHDPETGEVLDHQDGDGAHEIPCDGNNWIQWGGTLVAKMKAARSLQEVNLWVNANTKLLVQCMKADASIHGRIMKRLDELRAQWEQGGQP